MKKIALFDFDGTLSRGYISMSFLAWLKNKKIYSPGFYRKQIKVMEIYKKGKISYEDWCKKWGILWARGLAGKKEKLIKEEAKKFFEKFKKNIYPSSYKLVKLIKSRGYKTIQISTAASELTELSGKHLGIDKTYATKIKVKNGIYCDNLVTDFHLPGGKKRLLKKLFNSGKYNLNTSIAFGDSIHDIGLLEGVRWPVALNPSKELRKIAKKRKWLISDYKNIVKDVEKLLDKINV